MGVSALNFFLRVFNLLDLVQNPLIDMFLKGAQNKAPLPVVKNSIWDPSKVLENIQKRARPLSFLLLAREAAILLLLATGWQVDDIWKLGLNVCVNDRSPCFILRLEENVR